MSQVAELNLAADILVPEAYWGQSVDGLHPLDFTQFAAYLQAELVGLGIL
ncbi:MAG: hypothetical protein GY812_09525 [Actinomycetia bacterium]|nr:hypothetical protein [Actinomycetes bacterium]